MTSKVTSGASFDNMMMSILFGDAKPEDFDTSDIDMTTESNRPIGAETAAAMVRRAAR